MNQGLFSALILRFAAAAGLALVAVAPGAVTASEADFFNGKTFSVVVGYPPGGGYDAYARLLGGHIGRYIPGNPTVVVRNMPGASSIRSANYIFAKAPRDGTVLGLFASSAVFAPMLGNKGAQFSPDGFTWIGNLDQATGTCSVWTASGVASFQDLLKRSVIFGASGPAGFDSEYPRAVNAILGTRVRVIHGYNGATSVLLAMQRGEVQGGCGFPLGSLKSVRRDDFKAGRLKPVIQFALKSPELAAVAHVTDFAKSEEDRQVFNLIFNRDILGRPVAAPPGLVAGRTATLRAAFSAVINDKDFRQAAERQHLTLDTQDGTAVQAFVREIMAYSPKVIARAREALAVGKVENVELKSLEGKITKLVKGGVEITDASGRTISVKVSGRTSVLVGGKKANPKALKAGMACSSRYFGEGDLAKTMACH